VNPYATQLGNRNPLEVIAKTPQALEAHFKRLGPEGLEHSYASGKWSARSLFAHLADAELAFSFRLRQVLAEPHHLIQTFDQEAWARPYESLDARTALDAFSAVRRWNLALLHALPPNDFAKHATHPERGELTFQSLVDTMAGHDLNHLRQFDAIESQSKS